VDNNHSRALSSEPIARGAEGPKFGPILALAVPAGLGGLALLSAVAPSLGAFMASHLSLVLILAACCSCALAYAAFDSTKWRKDISAIADSLDRKDELVEDGAGWSCLANRPHMAPLVASIRGFLGRVEARQTEAFGLLASNRMLARELDRLFQVLDSLNEGLLVLDTASRVVFANKAVAPFLTTTPFEARDRLARDTLRQQEVLSLLHAASDEGSMRGVRSIELPQDEETGQGHVAVFQSHGFAEDESVGQVLVFRDMSRLKNMEALQADFVDSVAHELRTPLTSIQAYVEMLIDGEAEDAQSKADFYNVIHEETHRLSQLIDNLLNVSMMESGSLQLDTAPTRLKRLLEDSVEVIRAQCDSKSITLTADLPDRLPTLSIDKRLFGIAVMNILGNAVKYTPEGGAVSLSTSSHEEAFHIDVTDSGIGIPEEDLVRVFDKFYRSSSAQEAHGSGIGLATARQIVRLHGGDIRVKSTVGQGSTFLIVMPRTLIDTTIGE
jgi:two-component system, OmpR family, phosphate regulon sensor histidine kinase PhoR